MLHATCRLHAVYTLSCIPCIPTHHHSRTPSSHSTQLLASHVNPSRCAAQPLCGLPLWPLLATLTPLTSYPPPLARYRKLLLAVDLTKNFFFSHTYCLANTLQRNHDVLDGQDPCVYDNMFAWNSYLTR